MNYLIDTHAHLDFPELYSKLDLIIENAKNQNVLKIITISTNLNKIGKIIQISNNYDVVYFTVGVHPNEVLKDKDYQNYSLISDISNNFKCVGIGECGLDYHFGNEDKDKQKLSFITQIKVARDKKLPLIIHSRDADEDMIDILQDEYKKGAFKAILHCFSSGKDLALCGLDLGFYISFSGIVTFKSAKLIQEIACIVPKDRILVETDAPYLAPSPYRGSVNEPKNCFYTAKFLSDIRNIDFNEFTNHLCMNSLRIFDKML
ncbi:MAG: TatD family hydrolase [Alphaproteobacteria bacterium]|nr:TatD family hydrolase [Alphaproteobacteria bacterium]